MFNSVLVYDDQLFLKPTVAGEGFIGKVIEELPFQGAKPYFLIPREKWNDSDWLAKLIQLTAADLPLPKTKKS